MRRAVTNLTTVRIPRRTLFNASKPENEPEQPSKQNTDTIGQAKSDEGTTPAQQSANVVKQQNGSHAQDGKGHGQTQADLSKAKTVNIGSKDSEDHRKKDSAPG